MRRTIFQKVKKYTSLREINATSLVIKDMALLSCFILLNKSKIKQIKKDKKPIWLFCEQGIDARDSAWVLFEYVRKNCNEIDAYYIIDESSSNTLGYKKIEKIGNLIHRGTKKHKLYTVSADVLLDTHSFDCILPWSVVIYKKIIGIFGTSVKFIFLQHGVIKDDLSMKLGKSNNDFDIFICGAKPEYEYVLNNFGFKERVVQYTGLARYDNLHDIQTKNQILLMPTWRTSINGGLTRCDEVLTSEIFLTTEYYKTYQSLINDKGMNEVLEKNDIELIFYPHFNIQQFIDNFKTPSKNIKIANKESYDVQTLLKESKLLITDYSSVFFDFAYMNKPSIFFQFDEKEFFDKHYKKGYFDYRKDGFGEVVTQENDLIDSIEKVIKNNFEMEEQYKNRIEGFFPLHDQKNCERIFDVIKDLN